MPKSPKINSIESYFREFNIAQDTEFTLQIAHICNLQMNPSPNCIFANHK
jgi:hypothetical protein